MSQINNLMYFLKSIKETLPFESEHDFKQKIMESKEFRIKVQKLVYISKFFGWQNNYHFNFHKRGPYSVELKNDYQKLNEYDDVYCEPVNLKTELFKEFIKNKSNEFLEAASTILYYCDKVNLEINNETKIMTIISYLKPHLSENIIKKAYQKINEYKLFNFTIKNQKAFFDKEIVIDKIDGLTSIFESFETCSNQTLILGSLDYFKLALKKEHLEKEPEMELLNVIYNYGEYIEEYYFIHYDLSHNFPYFDLTAIDKKFDELQDYVSHLKILPRLYDEDVDLNIFCE